jgi:hypothetical protein
MKSLVLSSPTIHLNTRSDSLRLETFHECIHLDLAFADPVREDEDFVVGDRKPAFFR